MIIMDIGIVLNSPPKQLGKALYQQIPEIDNRPSRGSGLGRRGKQQDTVT